MFDRRIGSRLKGYRFGLRLFVPLLSLALFHPEIVRRSSDRELRDDSQDSNALSARTKCARVLYQRPRIQRPQKKPNPDDHVFRVPVGAKFLNAHALSPLASMKKPERLGTSRKSHQTTPHPFHEQINNAQTKIKLRSVPGPRESALKGQNQRRAG